MNDSFEGRSGRNYNTEELLREDVAHHMRPFTDYKELAAEFGLSPSARTRIKASGEKPQENPFIEMVKDKNAG